MSWESARSVNLDFVPGLLCAGKTEGQPHLEIDGQELIKAMKEDAFFNKVVQSQQDWAKRVVPYWHTNDAPFAMGYEHVFKTKLPA